MIASPSEAESIVLEYVGPVPRDAYLAKALEDYEDGNRHYQCERDLPDLSFAAGTAPDDDDDDGIPNWWEDAHGLNATDAADARELAPNGFMWIEVWANSLLPPPA
jgi:hypothetical protein